jgi:hypothetical protein
MAFKPREAIMVRPASQATVKLQRMTEQRDEFKALLQDAYDIISVQDDPDCAAWLGQARAALAKAAVMA